jgi:hypothetical protein
MLATEFEIKVKLYELFGGEMLDVFAASLGVVDLQSIDEAKVAKMLDMLARFYSDEKMNEAQLSTMADLLGIDREKLSK